MSKTQPGVGGRWVTRGRTESNSPEGTAAQPGARLQHHSLVLRLKCLAYFLFYTKLRAP